MSIPTIKDLGQDLREHWANLCQSPDANIHEVRIGRLFQLMPKTFGEHGAKANLGCGQPSGNKILKMLSQGLVVLVVYLGSLMICRCNISFYGLRFFLMLRVTQKDIFTCYPCRNITTVVIQPKTQSLLVFLMTNTPYTLAQQVVSDTE